MNRILKIGMSNCHRIACMLFAMILAGASSWSVAQESTSKDGTSVDQISVLIKRLDSDRYTERQEAMRDLRRAGVSAINPLIQAARGKNLEVTASAIEVLSRMYESSDPEVAIAADDALEALGEAGPPDASIRTQEILRSTLAPLRRRNAVAAIKRLGGHLLLATEFDENGEKMVEKKIEEEGSVQGVVLGKKWKGGMAGSKYLLRLPEIHTVYITRDSGLTAEDRVTLSGQMPRVKVETRGSAYLGIKSKVLEGELCLIDGIAPNSPAQRAGLEQDDMITHLNGVPLGGFRSLTERLESFKVGEVIYLEIIRDDQQIEIPVTLGEW